MNEIQKPVDFGVSWSVVRNCDKLMTQKVLIINGKTSGSRNLKLIDPLVMVSRPSLLLLESES